MIIPPIDFGRDDADMKKTVKQIAGTAAAVGVVALLPIEAPTVGSLWDWIVD